MSRSWYHKAQQYGTSGAIHASEVPERGWPRPLPFAFQGAQRFSASQRWAKGILPWHRRSSYEPDAPARGVPQSPRWRVGLVCARMRNFLAGVISGKWVLNAFRLHRGGHKAKGITGKWAINALRLHRGGHLLPFTFCLSGCPRQHWRRSRAEADPQCAHDGYRRGTTLPAPALPAMRFVFLQSAIQNPESRIQNHVSALRRCQLGHGHGQAIGARIHGSAPWKTEETIVGLPRLLALSAFSRFSRFSGCHVFTSSMTPDFHRMMN